jgi:hypothetical protein
LPHKAHGYWVDVFELLDVAVAALAGYDPHTGRFIQPDPHIQAPEHLQSFNRYSYVLNNPLNATDPTGEIWGWIAAAVFTAIVAKEVPELRPFLAIAWSIALAPGAGFVNMGIGPIAQTAVAGFTSGAIGSGSVKGGMRGMATAMLFYGVGRLADSQFVGAAQAAEKAADPVAALGNAQGVWGNGGLARIGLHALAGCASAGISGGDCGRGAATAGFTKAAGAYSPSFDGVAANTVKYAIIGGTVEVIGGGKFANGATTGAFQYLFNCLASKCNGADYKDKSPGHENSPYSSPELCNLSTNGCMAAARTELACNSAPGQSACNGVGKGDVRTALIGSNNVVTQYMPNENMIINGTSMGHRYHDGYIVRWIGVDSAGGVRIWTYGIGTNSSTYMALENQFGGRLLFEAIGVRNALNVRRALNQ